jgi:hypothetical protein
LTLRFRIVNIVAWPKTDFISWALALCVSQTARREMKKAFSLTASVKVRLDQFRYSGNSARILEVSTEMSISTHQWASVKPSKLRRACPDGPGLGAAP